MRKALLIGLFCGTAFGWVTGCKTNTNKVKTRVLPAGGTARIPTDWDGLSDWSGNAYILGDAP